MLKKNWICVFVFLTLFSGGSSSDINDASLKEFDEKINRMRSRSAVNADSDALNDDEDVNGAASGDSPMDPDMNEDKNGKPADDLNTEINICCQTGMSMASYGFSCYKHRLIYMTRRQKLQAMGAIFNDLHIVTSTRTKSSLYESFRRCVLKEVRHFMKCCTMGTQQYQGALHSNRDVGSRVRYSSTGRKSGFNRRFDNSLNRYKHRKPCKYRRCRTPSNWYANNKRARTRIRAK